MRKYFAALAVLFTLSTQAEILVYNSAVTVTTTGAGSVTPQVVSGFLVVDLTANRLVLLNVSIARKTFHIEEQTDWEIRNVQGKAPATFSVLSIRRDGAGHILAKGANSRVNLIAGTGSSDVLQIPLSAAVSGSILWVSGLNNMLDLYTGTLAFNAVQTKASNYPTIATMDATVARLRAVLLARNLTEQ